MKRIILRTSIRLVKFAMRLHGWSDAPRPPGFPPVSGRPWWRPMTGSKIAGATFPDALSAVMLEDLGLLDGKSGTFKGKERL